MPINSKAACDVIRKLPDVSEKDHFGSDAFSANKRIFVARDLMTEKEQFASFFVFDPDGYKLEVSWHNE